MRAFIFDTETDGLINNKIVRPEKWPRVIEFCGKVYDTDRKEVTEKISTLIFSGRKVPKEVIEITAIDDEMIANAPRLQDMAEQIRGLIGTCDLICAHNLSYDKMVMELEARRLDLPPFFTNQRKFCTVEATEHYKGHRLNLSALHEYLFSEPFSGAHRAEVDVDALVRCFAELVKRGEV